MNVLEELLDDYERLTTGGSPSGNRERKSRVKRVREIFEVQSFVCDRLVAIEQPKPSKTCGYCNHKPHEAFCVVATAQYARQLVRPKKAVGPAES